MLDIRLKVPTTTASITAYELLDKRLKYEAAILYPEDFPEPCYVETVCVPCNIFRRTEEGTLVELKGDLDPLLYSQLKVKYSNLWPKHLPIRLVIALVKAGSWTSFYCPDLKISFLDACGEELLTKLDKHGSELRERLTSEVARKLHDLRGFYYCCLKDTDNSYLNWIFNYKKEEA